MARNLAHDAGAPDQLPQVLTRLAKAAFSTGDPDRVRALLDDATEISRLGVDAVPYFVRVEVGELVRR